jgi:GT2 family glycosyltransferase
MKRVQIVIPVINLWRDYTKPCLASVIRASQNIDYRIFLIDNGSTDETQEEARKLISDRFIYHRNETSWPLAQTWNYGIRRAFEDAYDYVFVINNDVLIHPDAIDNLVDRLKDDKHGLVMATCMNVKSECDQLGAPEKLFELKSKDKTDVPEAEHPDFSAFMLNKRGWDLVGEFDEGFWPAYFEDNDYHYRINLLGLKAITLPTALFYHYGSRTQNQNPNQMLVSSLLFEKNRSYILSKWGSTDADQIRYRRPFNDVFKDAKWTLQKAHTGACPCNVKCAILLNRFGKYD